ncbi:hypothetical protein ACR6C2_42775 [Streptomyces sp. INA 01156]
MDTPLAEGDLAAVTNLGHALLGYHRVAIAPYWPRIRALVEADRAVRARSLLDGELMACCTACDRPSAGTRPCWKLTTRSSVTSTSTAGACS